MENETKKWTCVCGAVNTKDFCESCGTPREKVVNSEASDERKEKSGVAKDQGNKLADYLNSDRPPKETIDRYAHTARKEEQEIKSGQAEHLPKKDDADSIDVQGKWNCSCGKKGNTGSFCPNCGRAKSSGSNSSNEEMTEQTILLDTPVEANAPESLSQSVPVSSHTDAVLPNSSSRSSMSSKKKILLGATVVFLCLLGYMFYRTEKQEPVIPSASSLATDVKKNNDEKYIREMKTDLSLGGLDLGISTDEMHKAMGKENSTKDSKEIKGLTFYQFDTLKAGVIHDKIHSLVSNGSSAKTKRGLHEGSSYKDMIDAYGSDYVKMNYDNKVLYEYTFKSSTGEDGLLRFAINKSDQKVAYISVRIPEDNSAKQNQEKSVDIKGAQKVFLDYHKAISQKHLDDAYDMLTSDCQRHMGDLSTYASGYKDTLNSSVDSLKVVSSSADKVTMNYRLIARDRYKGNRVKVQTFNGSVTVVKQGNIWKIDQMKSSKIDEKIEN